MIGSSTYIIKQNGKFCAHVGGTFFDYMLLPSLKKKKRTVFEELNYMINGTGPRKKPWPKPEAEDISEEEVLRIADANTLSTNTADDNRPGCHRFAGDRVLLIDVDAKQAFNRNRRDTKWEEITFETCHEQMYPKNKDPVWQDESEKILKVLHKQYSEACKKAESFGWSGEDLIKRHNAHEQAERINCAIEALYGKLHRYHWLWFSNVGRVRCSTSSKLPTLTEEDLKRIPKDAQGPFNYYADIRRLCDK